MNNCLVIIDVQRGFITNDTLYVPEMIKRLLLKREFDHIVATRFINSVDSPHYVFSHWERMMDYESQKLDDYVEKVSERVFDKSINSCFSSDFLKYLNDNSIEFLYIVGIDTDCCVMKTAFDCFDRKLPFVVITNCCASTGGIDLHEAACKVMKRNFGDTMVLTYDL